MFYNILFLFFIFFNLFIGIFSECININQSIILKTFNISYDPECYFHTIHSYNDCCQYMLIKDSCKQIYSDCIEFKHFVLDNEIQQCNSHNTSILNIEYSLSVTLLLFIFNHLVVLI